MAINFPAYPNPGDTFSSAGIAWVWDGIKWWAAGLIPAYSPGIGDNRIINGDMRIDQRNNGAQGTANQYTVDRWVYYGSQAGKIAWQQRANVGCPGFPYALDAVSQSAYASVAADLFYFYQVIEADFISDFGWGATGAQSVTLSFWAYCTKTGTFSGSLQNYAGTRSYPFSYSIPTASTWTKITLTIPGDTAGTWVMYGNAGSVVLNFDLGCGTNWRSAAGAWAAGNYLGVTGAVSLVATNAATFYVTGVKLEIGSVATPFNRQSLAKSRADCQRYYCVRSTHNIGGVTANGVAINWNYSFPVNMRSSPTIVFSMTGGAGYTVGSIGWLASDGFNGVATGTAASYNSNVNWTASAEF